ncbi:protein pelota homolog [Sinocyclocheilus grahami]|uniref:protein pelota homolog n=1 Tax=Sinocyclocheilus grahami TaxID=75366 RepID=UPI0007AC9427|nr:PREDICTED: protein pelota homolog [Sinocyclocheilus grahami]
MKLAHKDIEKDNAGSDVTNRKVQTESSTGSVGSSRVRTTLTLCVATIDFDSQACQLRVKGTNIQENQYVKMGAYHTIELELNRTFTLAKKVWDSVVLDRIEQACDPAQKADVAAVVMQEGLANLVLVTPAMTLLRAKVEVTIPRKRKGSCTQHDKFLFHGRHQDIATRSRYVRLVDNVKENGGNVRIFSSLHVSGEQLNQLSGVVAVLRFPIADMSEAEEDSSSDED